MNSIVFSNVFTVQTEHYEPVKRSRHVMGFLPEMAYLNDEWNNLLSWIACLTGSFSSKTKVSIVQNNTWAVCTMARWEAQIEYGKIQFC